MALSADTRPHFTTVADFISGMDKEIVQLFLEVLLVCDEQGGVDRQRDVCHRRVQAAEQRFQGVERYSG